MKPALLVCILLALLFACKQEKLDSMPPALSPPAKPLAPIAKFYELPIFTGEYTFNNQSENADSFVWSFGDGQTSLVKAPIIQYKRNGDYSVSLTAKGPGGEHTITKLVQVGGVRGKVTFWTAGAGSIFRVFIGHPTIPIGRGFPYLGTGKPACLEGVAYSGNGDITYTAEEEQGTNPRRWSGTVTLVSGECMLVELVR